MLSPREYSSSSSFIERAAPAVPSVAGAWSVDSLSNAAIGVDVSDAAKFAADLKDNVSQEQRARVQNLSKAIKLVCRKLKRRPPNNKLRQLIRNPGNHKLEQELVTRLEEYLGNPRLAAYLQALLRGEYNNVPKLPREILELEKRGFVRIESVQYFSAELNE